MCWTELEDGPTLTDEKWDDELQPYTKAKDHLPVCLYDILGKISFRDFGYAGQNGMKLIAL